MKKTDYSGIKGEPGPNTVSGWNPRFARYARAMGCLAIIHLDEFVRQQEMRYPSAKMQGFANWIVSRWEEFGMETVGRRDRDAIYLMLGQDAQQIFDAWLGSKYPFPT